jgi:hypothetical protein
MEEDIVKRMRAEEADLVRKLDAVRQFLAVYGGAPKPVTLSRTSNAMRPSATRPSLAARVDKFGSYGQGVIDAACKFLPGESDGPMLTRDLLAKLERQGVQIRGKNPLNALSALLARSSQVKGWGRSGWTLAGERHASEIAESRGIAAPNETKAPAGDAESASVVAKTGAPTPGSAAWVNPQSGWHS